MIISPNEKVYHDARLDYFLFLEATTSRFRRNYYLQKDTEQDLNEQLFFFGILPEDTGLVHYYKVGVNFNEN